MDGKLLLKAHRSATYTWLTAGCETRWSKGLGSDDLAILEDGARLLRLIYKIEDLGLQTAIKMQ
jgi:hypothetical protein